MVKWGNGFWVATAAIVVACGGTVVAQQMAERASATAHRNVPAKAPFDASMVSTLRVPPGFAVNVFASGLGQPRMLEVGPDGTVFVTRRGSDDVLALRDGDGDGVADTQRVFAAGLTGVHGIARMGNDLFLASSETVWRTPIGTTAAPVVVIGGLPDGGQHPNRTVRVGPDGQLYVSVGSSCNDCAEENQLERGTMIRYSPDGATRTVLAKGLRNTIGYDWHPVSGALWGMDHGSDFHGNDVPPEELNEIKAGANYGWPVCYGERVVDPMTNTPPEKLTRAPGEAKPPGTPITREAYCALTEPSVLTTTAHSAPMAMRFYTATQFPAPWRGDAFVAMRGSWNRETPVGYKVVRVRFDGGTRPVAIEDFVTGFLNEAGTAFFARPTGMAIAADGALLVSDDSNGVIYRIAWRGQ
jgi:glucose/arabinose dehydrogenase